jgi:hypothetical protein
LDSLLEELKKLGLEDEENPEIATLEKQIEEIRKEFGGEDYFSVVLSKELTLENNLLRL